MPSVLVLAQPEEAFRRRLLAAAPGSVTFAQPSWDRATLLAHMAQSEVVLGDPAPEDLSHCRRLALLQTTWDGVEHYLSAGIPTGAVLCNAAGAYGVTIAEYAIAVLFSLCRRIPAYVHHQQQALWRSAGEEKPLEDAMVLIVGAGSIGTALAERLRPSVRKIVGVCRTARACAAPYDAIATADALDALLPQADVVVCCLPSTAHTRGWFDASRLSMLRRDAVFVNVGRGDLVDTDALAAQLSAGHLFGAALDVTAPEPLPPAHPLWHAPRCLLTPHISGNAFAPGSRTHRRIWEICTANVERFCSGQPLQNVVSAAGYGARQ